MEAMRKLRQIMTSTRMIILLVVILLAILAIHPKLDTEGAAIRSVVKNSAAFEAKMEGPDPTSSLTSREIILAVNNKPVKSVEDYYELTKNLEENVSIKIKTSKESYKLTTKPLLKTDENNNTQKIGVEDLGIKVYPVPSNNLKKGLDLEGGTRVLLQPETAMNNDDMETLIASMKERLNVYGLTDLSIRKTNDLTGNQYILVEIAGASEEEVKDLLAKQGKFEAKIGEKTVFIGGKDIVYVCRSAECAGIDPYAGCGNTAEGIACRFRFVITLSTEAAQKHADTTSSIGIKEEAGEQYLEQQLDLYLDNEKIDSLNIAADLKGRAVTDIAISGSGLGNTREGAVTDAMANMKRLQTILITGSLPVKLEIVKIDAVSPILGEKFLSNAVLVGLLAILSVGAVVFIRYRTLSISLAIMGTMVSEVLLLLGFAAIVKWQLDLLAIAGIIVAAGTGVDQQVIITDELMRGKAALEAYNWKEKISNAFFIIMGAYLTGVVAMIPLLFAGAGLVKGFAFTTIVGVSIGVFITRPAYAAVAERLLK